MEPLEIELEVGETLFLGDYSLTLLETDGERIDVRIGSTEGFDAEPSPASSWGDSVWKPVR